MPAICPDGRAAVQIAPTARTARTGAARFTLFTIGSSLTDAEPAEHAEEIAFCGLSELCVQTSLLFVLRGGCRLLREHLAEHLHRLGHLFHRAERDAGVCLVERR